MIPILSVLVAMIYVIFAGVPLRVFQEVTSFYYIGYTFNCICHVEQKITFQMVLGLKL